MHCNLPSCRQNYHIILWWAWRSLSFLQSSKLHTHSRYSFIQLVWWRAKYTDALCWTQHNSSFVGQDCKERNGYAWLFWTHLSSQKATRLGILFWKKSRFSFLRIFFQLDYSFEMNTKYSPITCLRMPCHCLCQMLLSPKTMKHFCFTPSTKLCLP